MTEKNVILCCDTTDHGGRVLEGYASMPHGGHRVAGKGHQVFCPQCNGIFPIVEAVPLSLGYAPAVEGMRTACGARLIASQNTLKLDDGAGAATGDHGAAGESANAPPAGVSPAAFDAARHAGDVHVVLRVGVFHDGTGNNFTNSVKAQERCAPSAVAPSLDQHPDVLRNMMDGCLKHNGMSGASFEGGETNVHRLYDLYKVTDKVDGADVGKDGRRYVYRHVYVDGIATEADHPDSLWASATGYGPTGVIARAEQAIPAVVARIKDLVAQNPTIIIDAVVLDLFGFSRGAIASRHFAYLVRHGGMESAMARALRSAGLPLNPAWGTRKDDLTLGFIGLFDSVAAMGIPGSDNNDPVHLYLSGDCADAVVQLRAADECRLNFALNDVGSHTQIALPGVHSDIGGGYALEGWEHLILGKPETSEEPLGSDPLDSKAWDRAFRQKDTYHWWDDTLLDPDAPHTTRGTPDNKLFIETWTSYTEAHHAEDVAHQRRLFVTAAVVLQRHVRGEYQRIPLRIMHALAQDKGVPFKAIPNEPQYALPDELIPIKDKLLAFARGGGGGAPPLTEDEQRLLHRRYLHQSANWNPVTWNPLPDKKDSLPWGPGFLFAMRPTDNRIRRIFPQRDGH